MNAESPCIRVCTLDPRAGVCIGCFRTLDEIGYWTRMADGERAAVNEKLPARRAAFESMAAWKPSTCSRCGADFGCGAGDPDRPCWCTGYAAVEPSGPDATCLCPKCLSSPAGG